MLQLFYNPFSEKYYKVYICKIKHKKVIIVILLKFFVVFNKNTMLFLIIKMLTLCFLYLSLRESFHDTGEFCANCRW